MVEKQNKSSSISGRARPLYQRIRDYLLGLMESGKLQPGDQLPSENMLAKQFNTTRATVVSGFQQLVHEGRIVRKVGRGSFVAERVIDAALVSKSIQSLEEQLVRQGSIVTYKFLSFDLVKPDQKVSDALGLRGHDEIYRLERVRLSDGQPISLEIRHVTRDVGRNMTVHALEELVFMDILQGELGLKVGKITGTVTAVAASELQAALLAIRPNAPLIFREYVFYDSGGQAISHGESYYRSEVRFQYTMTG